MALAFTVTAAHASASGRADRADVGVGVDGDADADADKGEDVADAPFASVLTGGVALAEPGGQRGGTPGATTHGTTTAFVLAEAETRPLHLGLGWYGGVGISGGSMPVLAMVTAGQVAEPMYKRGTVVATALRFSKSSRVIDLAGVARAGSARISIAPVTLNEHGTTRVYAAAANDIDEWALFFDARCEIRWYDRDVATKRRTMHTLDPLLRASVGLRHDERFHRTGDLQPFADPTGRVFFDTAFHPVRTHGVSVGASFAFEGALRGDYRLPSGYRLALESTADLGHMRRRHRESR